MSTIQHPHDRPFRSEEGATLASAFEAHVPDPGQPRRSLISVLEEWAAAEGMEGAAVEPPPAPAPPPVPSARSYATPEFVPPAEAPLPPHEGLAVPLSWEDQVATDEAAAAERAIPLDISADDGVPDAGPAPLPFQEEIQEEPLDEPYWKPHREPAEPAAEWAYPYEPAPMLAAPPRYEAPAPARSSGTGVRRALLAVALVAAAAGGYLAGTSDRWSALWSPAPSGSLEAAEPTRAAPAATRVAEAPAVAPQTIPTPLPQAQEARPEAPPTAESAPASEPAAWTEPVPPRTASAERQPRRTAEPAPTRPTPAAQASTARAPEDDELALSTGPRIVIHYARGSARGTAAAERLRRELLALDLPEPELKPVSFHFRNDSVRLFHDEDRALARRVDAELAEALGQRSAPSIQDYRRFQPAPRPGTVEVWISPEP
ncbi:MAG TPA: hypothetical protein VED40_07550 [Azospirillaceae bacterium]|nr:hypothetical protein [Azospirillaceae bacterium]